jgi:hypothetical protein
MSSCNYWNYKPKLLQDILKLITIVLTSMLESFIALICDPCDKDV